MKRPFPLLPVLLLLSSPPALAASSETIGRVVSVSGSAEAVAPDGSRRALQRGSQVLEGDTLLTGANGNLTIRMEDAQMLALRPGTEYRLLEFPDSGTGAGQPVRHELVSGGFRSIIGNNTYRLETSLGTLENINATYECALDVQLWCGVYDGMITIRNGEGSLRLGLGSKFAFAQVPTAGTPPIGLLHEPDELMGTLSMSGGSGSIQRGGPGPIPLSQNPGFPEPAPIVVTPIKQ